MSAITLAIANKIIEGALAHGTEKEFKPLSVVALDAGGHVIAFQRQDGASMLRFEIASGKAYGALSIGFGSRWLEKAAAERPHFIAGLNAVSGDKVVPVAGGVLVRNADGELLGAIGVSGDTSDNDENAALHGIQAAGLSAQTS